MTLVSRAFLILLLIIFQALPVFAQAAPGAAESPGFFETLMRMLPMFILLFLIFYFLLIRPQNMKLRAQQQFLSSLQKGQKVITSGGIIGRVAGIEKDYILLDVGSNVRLKIQRSHIQRREETPKPEESKTK